MKYHRLSMWGLVAAVSLATPLLAKDKDKNKNKNKDVISSESSAAVTPSDRELGRLFPADRLIGRDVRDANGRDLGEVRDLIVDLESGRVLYGIVDLDNGGRIAVPATMLAGGKDLSNESSSHLNRPLNQDRVIGRRADRSNPDSDLDRDNGRRESWEWNDEAKNRIPQAPGNVRSTERNRSANARAGAMGRGNDLMFSATKDQLKNAPKLTREQAAQLDDVSYASQIYKHYGAQTWWTATGAGGKFGNVHRASDLHGMHVRNINDQEIGTVDQAVVDLAAGRVAFIGLDPSSTHNRIAVPPMALTPHKEGDYLTLNADVEKLRTAPKISSYQSRNMSDPKFASEVYRFWGKQPYFDSDLLLTPTGPDQPRRR